MCWQSTAAAGLNKGSSQIKYSSLSVASIFSAITKPLNDTLNSWGLGDLEKKVHTGFKNFAESPAISTWFTLPNLTKIAQAAAMEREEAVQKVTASQPKDIVYSHDRPLRILMVGDSMAGLYTAQVFRSMVKEQPAMDLDILQKISSTLSEPKYFDWPVEISARAVS